jgi:formylglycine-generating enzyme
MNRTLIKIVRQPGRLLALLCTLGITSQLAAWAASPPVIGPPDGYTSLVATQRAGTKLVDISFKLSDPDSTSVGVYILVSANSGTNWNIPAHTCTGAYGTNVAVTATPTATNIVWDAGADWDGNYTANCRVRVVASDTGLILNSNAVLVLIPAGSYMRGNRVDSAPGGADSDITDATNYPVYVSAFYMDSTLVNGGLWNGVRQWALANGYAEFYGGISKAPDHPVEALPWHACVEWCNARSEKEGLEPVYYTDAGFSTVYKNGQQGAPPYMKPSAKGYRLPTEAEWEKAARGGLSGKRFPWGDTINEALANYLGDTTLPYDSGPNGYNSTYAIDPQPYTSPVGSFAANGYGLFDMAGNVFEWCWDWYSNSYYASGQADPQGPNSSPLSYRVIRGGCWGYYTAAYARCANRLGDLPGNPNIGYFIGFRCVRGL